MLKKISVSVVVMMLAVSTAQAFDPPDWPMDGFNIQSQDLHAQLEGLIEFDQSEQHTTNFQWIDVFNKHELENAHDINAWQHQKYFLSDASIANADSANLAVVQASDAMGSQLQLVKGGVGEKAQWQAQGLDSVQAMAKLNGEADVVGNGSTFLNESQAAENLAGSMFESSNIIGDQSLSYIGEPTAVGEVQLPLSVDVQQSQIVVN